MTDYKVCFAILKRDLLIAWRRPAEVLEPIVFAVLVMVLFPLAIGSEPARLHSVAPAMIWISILLAVLLTLPQMFSTDYADGSLELLIISGHSLSLIVFTKIIAHWVIYVVPMLILVPVFALIWDMPTAVESTLLLSLLMGTPALCLTGATVSALTVSMPNTGLLLPILIIPFYTPVLIFACTAVQLVNEGMAADAQIHMLGALLFLSLALGPLPASAAIRLSLD